MKDEIINTNIHLGRHLDGDAYLLYNTLGTDQLYKSTNRMGNGKMVLYGEMICSCIKEPRRSLRLESFDGIADEVKDKNKIKLNPLGSYASYRKCTVYI